MINSNLLSNTITSRITGDILGTKKNGTCMLICEAFGVKHGFITQPNVVVETETKLLTALKASEIILVASQTAKMKDLPISISPLGPD